jgi:hypothetical protein
MSIKAKIAEELIKRADSGIDKAAEDFAYRIGHRPMTVEGGASRLEDLTPSFGDDIYDKNALQYFGSGDAREKQVLDIFNKVKGNPDAEVSIFRGLPNDNNRINEGDWVTLSKDVAQDYADFLPEGGQVVEMKVPAGDVTAWSDSLLEQGYYPQKAKIAAELAERLQGGDSLAMDFASRMQGKSSAIGAGTLATGGLMASDDSEAGVGKLAMDAASRLKRAKDQEFSDDVAYRGIYGEYNPDKSGNYQMFTSSPEDAGEYGNNVIQARLKKGNNLAVNGGGNNFNSIPVGQLPDEVRSNLHPSVGNIARTDDISYAAQKAGYDSVTFKNVYDNASGEIPQKPAPKKDEPLSDDLLALLDEFDASGLSDSIPDVDLPPEIPKNYDPVDIDVVFDPSNIRSVNAAFDPAKKDSSNLLAEMGAGIAATSTLPWMAKRAEAAEQERISAQIDESIANMSRGQTIEAPSNPYYQTAADAVGKYNRALKGSPAEYLLGAEDLESYLRKGAYGEANLGDAGWAALNLGEMIAAPLEGLGYLTRTGDGVISNLIKGNL